MVDLAREARLLGLVHLLALHEGYEVFDGLGRLFAKRLALKVDQHHFACLDLRVRQEELEEGLNRAFALLQKALLHVAEKLLLWERWQRVYGTNAALHHGLELTNR